MGQSVKLHALDLFAGAGGMSEGFKQAGIDVVAAVEYDSQIAETYKYNHKGTNMLVADIKNVSCESIKGIFESSGKTCNIIFGGPPCQGFSMAGKRIRKSFRFLEDQRNYLFKEYIRMVECMKPSVFVIENVPGILNYNNGSVKEEINETFQKLGYKISSKVLCAADYGVPQLRHRAVFIGNNLGIDPEKMFPIPTNANDNYISVYEAISDLPALNSGEGTEEMQYTVPPQSEYQKELRKDSNVIFNHISSTHSPETLFLLSMIKQGQTMKDLPEMYHTKSVHSGAYGRMDSSKPAYTLTTRINTPSVGRITHPIQNRTITPREAARIQSFPDTYRFVGDITSIGKQIGNAVPPLLAKRIASQILFAIEESLENK